VGICGRMDVSVDGCLRNTNMRYVNGVAGREILIEEDVMPLILSSIIVVVLRAG